MQGNSPCFISLVNTIYIFGRIQGGAKLFASVEGRKIQGAKLTLYTVAFPTKHTYE